MGKHSTARWIALAALLGGVAVMLVGAVVSASAILSETGGAIATAGFIACLFISSQARNGSLEVRD